MAGGMSDKLTVAQKNRIVKNQTTKDQITSSDLSGTGVLTPVNPHKIKMSDGLSDKLTVAQKNRIVNGDKGTVCVNPFKKVTQKNAQRK